MFSEWINGWSEIHSWLPFIIRFGITSFIILVALLPASIAFWVICNATKKPFYNLLEYLSVIRAKVLDQIDLSKISISNSIEEFVANNSIKYVFGIEASKIRIQEAQDIIDTISTKGSEFPAILESRLHTKEEPYAELNQKIEDIQNIKIDPIDIEVRDDYELLEEDFIKKRKGITIILIFGFVSLFAMFANTALLAMFWGDLGLDIRLFKILGQKIELSHVIAFMLTIVEIGFGAALAIQTKEKSKNSIIIYGIGMCFISFCLVESFVYFALGTEFFQGMPALNFLPEGYHGLVLAPIGPIFVTALFIFGHFLSNAYYDVREVNSMEKFKVELASAKHLSESAYKSASSFNEILTHYVKNIKEAFSILKISKDTSKVLPESNYLKELESVVSKAKDTLKNIEKNMNKDIPNVIQKLGADEVKRYFYTMVFKFFVTVFAAISFMVLHAPLLRDSISLDFNYFLYHIFGLLEFSSAIVVGYIWSHQVRVQLENKGSDEVIIDGKSAITKIMLIAYLVLVVSGICYTTLIHTTTPNFAAFILLIGCIVVAFIIGQTLRIMLQAITTLIKIIFYFLKIAYNFLLLVFSQLSFLLINGIINILNIFSYPSLTLYKIIFSERSSK